MALGLEREKARLAAPSGHAFGGARHACANSKVPADVQDLLVPGIPRSTASVPTELPGPASTIRPFTGVASGAMRAAVASTTAEESDAIDLGGLATLQGANDTCNARGVA